MERETSDGAFARRLVASVSVSGDSRKLEKAKAMLHEALYQVAAYLADGECDDVFHLGALAVPFTRSEK